MNITKQRIEFIDLAKGVCIILVVMGHCGLNQLFPTMTIVRMPLYFILSGIFFKTYSGFFEFLIRKINKILIPFLFFLIVPFTTRFLYNLIIDSEVMSINYNVDLFGGDDNIFDGPIWFLLALFWTGIYSYIILKYIKCDYVRIILFIVLGFSGWYLGYKGIRSPLYLFNALTALPFFAAGYYINKTKFLYEHKYDKFNIFFIVILLALSYIIEFVTAEQRMSLRINIMGNPIYHYPLGIIQTTALLLICKVIKRIPFISYVGRYSIVVLCTHWFFRIILLRISPNMNVNKLYLFFIVLFCSSVMIPICKRVIPWFVAQKDLIPTRFI